MCIYEFGDIGDIVCVQCAAILMLYATAFIFGFLAIVYIFIFKENPDQIFDVQLNSTYDYIIVGAGSAGAVIANRLTEDKDVTVLLLEAGGSELKNKNIPIPINVGRLQMTEEDWGYYSVPQKASHKAMNDQQSYVPKGRVLGGTSCLNYMAIVRGSRHDYDQWASEGCSGWSFKDVLPYFMKMEDTQIPSLYHSPYRSRNGNLPVTEVKVSPISDMYSMAAKELGLNEEDLNGEDMIGFSRMQSSIKNGERQSTASTYIRPILGRPNLHISLNTLVTKILIKEKKAVGVQIIKNNRKQKVNVKKEVIVSAGAINSPQLLMLSGLGPRKHLEDLGIPVIADLPVGENLEDHLMFFTRYRINQSDLAVNSEMMKSISNQFNYKVFGKGWNSFVGSHAHFFGHRSDRKKDTPAYPDYQITSFDVAHEEGFIDHGMRLNIKQEIKDKLKTRASRSEFSLLCILLHPRSKGTVRLRSKDPFDYPAINPNYLDHPEDVNDLITAIRMSQKIAATKPFQRINATLNRLDFDGICNKEKFDTDSYWECLIRYFAVSVYHHVSTCRMGATGDKSAVVDPQLRVKGVGGLRVADASVMRKLPSGNTYAPVIMIGEKAADIIQGTDTVREFRQKAASLNL